MSTTRTGLASSPASRILFAVCLASCSIILSSTATAQDGSPRTAAQIISEFDSVAMPSFSDGSSEEAIRDFREKIERGCLQKAKLARELYISFPGHRDLPRLLEARWALMTNALDKAGVVVTETQIVLEDNDDPTLRNAAHLAASWGALHHDAIDAARRKKLVETAIRFNPDSDHCAIQMYELAARHTPDPAEMKRIIDDSSRRWPDNQWARSDFKRLQRVLKHVGQAAPEFRDLSSENSETLDLTREEAEEFTVVRIQYGTYKSAAKAVAMMKALAKRDATVRLLSVYVGAPQVKVENVREHAKTSGVTWPVHFDVGAESAKDPWTGLSATQFVLVSNSGKIVGLSTGLATIVARIKSLRR